MTNSRALLVAAVLSVTQMACTTDTETKAVPDQTTEQTNKQGLGLTINFDAGEGDGFTDEDKALITEIITESERNVRALLPTLPEEIEVNTVLIDRNVDVVGGVTGRADAPGVVLIEVSRVYPGGVSAAVRASLSSSIFHEFHHLNRGWTIQGNKYPQGIDIAIVNEGLASIFAEEYTGEYFAEAYDYPENVTEWLDEVLALPVDANYSEWMMAHPDGRDAIGYRVGRYVIHQAAGASGKDVLELSELSPEEILGMLAAR